jgi:hypothetical protein
LSRLATSFVLGYHGCDRAIAQKAVMEGAPILHSNSDYDWLGPGAYFWEADPLRAAEWAQEKSERGAIKDPAVIGAVIDLGNCLDLMSRGGVIIARAAYASFVELQKNAGPIVPSNKNPPGVEGKDHLLRYLDCAVLKYLHELVKRNFPPGPFSKPYDTVRGVFVEGPPAYSGSGFYSKSHVQIAVLNQACIKGVFYVRSGSNQ